MGSRFEKFSERARRVLSLAQQEAQRFNHNYIGTEHLLIALSNETEGMAAQVLSGLGVDLGQIRPKVEFIIGRGQCPSQSELGLTPRAKKVIELAVDEVRRLDHSYIGTEHLLIGLLREGEGVAAGVLESMDVTLEKARAETHRILSNSPPSARQDSTLRRPSSGESRESHTRSFLLGADYTEGRIEEIVQRLANLESHLNSRFDALEAQVSRLEQLLRDR